MKSELFIERFNADAEEKGGYLYTTNQRISSQLATNRTTEIILETRRFFGKSVVDVGCGDGFYTLQFWDNGHPKKMIGVDRAVHAINLSNKKKKDRSIVFQPGDAHFLPFAGDSFDLALIQSILHHDNNPKDIIREAFRIAREIIIHEPNGYNFGLKVIEKTSTYHRLHGEKSYTLSEISKWVKNANGRVVSARFAGFVPMFCPDSLARLMKCVEPLIERIPIINRLFCAVVVIVAVRNDNEGGDNKF